MRRLRSGWAAFVVSCVLGGLAASAHGADDPDQNLTVWIVLPMTAADHAVQRAYADVESIKQYRETTAGNFGKSASETGQTAGSYGHPASEEGRPASEAGQTAGSYGQTASSLPSNVKSQTAGSYGQTAGSFGTSASDFTGAPPARNVAANTTTASRESKGPQWMEFLKALHDALPRLQVRFVEVHAASLRQVLASVAGTAAAPDVLLSDRMPDWWASAAQGRVLVGAGASGRRQSVYHDAIGLAAAPHPVEAREFLEWWNGQELLPELRSAGSDAHLPVPATVALAAVGQVLGGSTLDGLADAEAARFSGAATRAEVLNAAGALPGDLGFRTDVVQVVNNDRFAAVLLHAQCASRTLYCDLYPLVLLRAGRPGQWKVLQLSVGLSGGEAERGFKLAQAAARPGIGSAQVALPKLASPPDGDSRAAHAGLDLWWDNGGGASTVGVEWQAGAGRDAPASHIELTSDTDPRVQTRVPAPFTDTAGPVRWRVWALGQGGVVRLTEWRTVQMVQ